MRTRNSVERLAAAGRPLLAEAESLVGAVEEERILARIVASDRSVARHRRPIALAVVAVGLIAAAGALASIAVERGSSPSAAKTGGHQPLALTGARIQLAGYRFKTPAGFVDSNSSCTTTTGAGGAFSAAASADGGCVEAFVMLDKGSYAIAPDAEPIDVGDAQGYLVTASDSITLYAPLPQEGEYSPYLMLVGTGLTADQLVAIAESGLPKLFEPTATTGTEGGG